MSWLDKAKELAKAIQSQNKVKELVKLTDLSIETDPDEIGWYKIKVPQEFNKEWDIENSEVKELFKSIQKDFQDNPGMESIMKIKNNKLSLAPVEGRISQNTLEKLQNLFISTYIEYLNNKENFNIEVKDDKYLLNVKEDFVLNFKENQEFVNFLQKYINIRNIENKEKQPYLIDAKENKNFSIVVPKTSVPEEISKANLISLFNIVTYRE